MHVLTVTVVSVMHTVGNKQSSGSSSGVSSESKSGKSRIRKSHNVTTILPDLEICSVAPIKKT